MALLGKRLGVAVLGGALGLGLWSGCTKKEVEVDPLEGYRFAVVELQPLVEMHPEFSKLEQLNKEISELQAKKLKIENESRQKLISQGGNEMQQAVDKARKKLEAERSAVEGEIAALNSSLSAQVQGEMQALQASYQAELEAEVKRLVPQAAQAAPPQQPQKLDSNTEAQIADYLQNLSLVRERNLAAKRLELEKRVGDEISAMQAEVNGQIAAYEADLAAQYQSERLNLQLTAQNSTDEAAKTQAETRLGEISNEIESAKAAKRAELEGGYSAVRAEKTAQVQGQLEAYHAELEAEVQAKLEAKRREIGMSMPSAPRPQPVPVNDPRPEINAKVAEIQSRMQAQLESKKAALVGQMEAKMAEAKVRLEAKQAEVTKNLEALNKNIGLRIDKELANLPEAVKGQLKEVDSKIEKLQEESKKLYESIRADIDTQVGGIAQDKKHEMVIATTHFHDPSFQDLTDLSQVRIQQMESKK